LVSKLAGDNEALFALVKLVGGAHLGAYRFAERDVEVQRAAQARIKKHVREQERHLALDAAIEAAKKKVKDRPARSDAYAGRLRPHVLETLGVTPEKPGERQVWPSIRTIRDKFPRR
jgi:hypothetical protein